MPRRRSVDPAAEKYRCRGRSARAEQVYGRQIECRSGLVLELGVHLVSQLGHRRLQKVVVEHLQDEEAALGARIEDQLGHAGVDNSLDVKAEVPDDWLELRQRQLGVVRTMAD